jgi:hypothetical protein
VPARSQQLQLELFNSRQGEIHVTRAPPNTCRCVRKVLYVFKWLAVVQIGVPGPRSISSLHISILSNFYEYLKYSNQELVFCSHLQSLVSQIIPFSNNGINSQIQEQLPQNRKQQALKPIAQNPSRESTPQQSQYSIFKHHPPRSLGYTCLAQQKTSFGNEFLP